MGWAGERLDGAEGYRGETGVGRLVCRNGFVLAMLRGRCWNGCRGEDTGMAMRTWPMVQGLPEAVASGALGVVAAGMQAVGPASYRVDKAADQTNEVLPFGAW